MNHPLFRRSRRFQALTFVGFLTGLAAQAQVPTAEERLQILTEPESVKAKLEKERTRPPIELFRSQIAPFDILPFIKANHWSTLSLEMRANYDNYVGTIHTAPVRLLGMPHDGRPAEPSPRDVVFQREARLLKEQRARLSLQLLMPRIRQGISLDLSRPDAIRSDETWQASLRTLEPHQMLILILSKDSTELYARWNHIQAMSPRSADRGDSNAYDRQRYYRLVLPQDDGPPPLSSHPLTWGTISHVIWDGFPVESLTPVQQQAMLDWLHWGGQLILVGGATPSLAALSDSFLGEFLPASLSGENPLLNENDLKPLSDTYRPLTSESARDEPKPVPLIDVPAAGPEDLYLAPEPIRPASNRPVFLTGLRPHAGSYTIRLGEESERILGVERRVGRGRMLMLAINPTDPALAAWPGLDTFVRRVVLRRPEDLVQSWGGWKNQNYTNAQFQSLVGPDLSWYRMISRDLVDPTPSHVTVARSTTRSPVGSWSRFQGEGDPDPSPLVLPDATASAVAEWVDSSTLPRMTRDALESASGISIPSSRFVLTVILAYVLALVPLNWLICRYLFNRREWAWVVVPVLSFGFAIGVERAAAYDMGYDIACDEINVLETHGAYPRGHLSRFGSLYSTGRTRFKIAFPDDPTALALPMDNGRSLRGEDVTTSTWQSQPVPALNGFQVEPRSLSLFRAEQMLTLPGSITLVEDEQGARIVNESELELRAATVIRRVGSKDATETYLGTIPPGATVPLTSQPIPTPTPLRAGQLDPGPFLKAFLTHHEPRPENEGETRLVAWTPRIMPGAVIEPAVDRHRGFTAVVVHLEGGPPPPPFGPRYDYLARFSRQNATRPEEWPTPTLSVPDPKTATDRVLKRPKSS